MNINFLHNNKTILVGLRAVPTHPIWMQLITVFNVEHFGCWTNTGRGEVSGKVLIWPPQTVALNCGHPSQWFCTQCGPAIAVMFSSWGASYTIRPAFDFALIIQASTSLLESRTSNEIHCVMLFSGLTTGSWNVCAYCRPIKIHNVADCNNCYSSDALYRTDPVALLVCAGGFNGWAWVTCCERSSTATLSSTLVIIPIPR